MLYTPSDTNKPLLSQVALNEQNTYNVQSVEWSYKSHLPNTNTIFDQTIFDYLQILANVTHRDAITIKKGLKK